MTAQFDQAVILAAGVGSRLKWLTQHKPKALVEIKGVPVIIHIIRRLAAQGVRDIAINIHHQADQLISVLGDGSRYGVRLYYSYEEQLLDSGGGVQKALEKLPHADFVIVHNADIFADIDLKALASNIPNHGASLTMVENPIHNINGDFSHLDGLITLQGRKKHTFSGVSIWHRSTLLRQRDSTCFSLLLPMYELIEKQRLTAYTHRGYWFDIGRPRDLIISQGVCSKA
ncbi:MAG: nucleotidyltransferase family protein [Mariprofundaceae bacterium]